LVAVGGIEPPTRGL